MSASLRTIAFQTDDEALHGAFTKLLGTIAKKPEDFKLLTPTLLALDLAIKVDDRQNFMGMLGQYGMSANMLRAAKIAAGELDDDCDCNKCAARRAMQVCERAQEEHNLTDTFVRYYQHLARQSAFEDVPVKPWPEALEDWKTFTLEQRLASCESTTWSYAAHIKSVFHDIVEKIKKSEG